MRISIFGAGYVGLTTAAVLADNGHDILLVERVEEKINQLQSGQLPFYEPGLEALVQSQIASGRLRFTPTIQNTSDLGELTMICVGTPPLADGSPNLSFLHSVLDTIAARQPQGLILITKSSVPPSTNAWIAAQLRERGIESAQCLVISNPEFLREGTALEDTRLPSRILFGFSAQLSASDFQQTIPKLQALYAGIEGPVLYTTWEAAELIKYASNAFLACKISFANELARICDAYAADIRVVAKGVGMDPRIGTAFLGAGLGYGGSCLPKDLAALQHAAREKSVETDLLPAVAQINQNQISHYLNKLSTALEQTPLSKRIAVWGIAFKPDTDDTRMSPAVALIESLVESGWIVQMYDPVAKFPNANLLQQSDALIPFEDQYAVLEGASALVVCTEWRSFQFDVVDWQKVCSTMTGDFVLDARNLYLAEDLQAFGLTHLAIARPSLPDFLTD